MSAIVCCMSWVVLFSDEVDSWFSSLKGKDRRIVYDLVEMLADQGPGLGFPHARPLGKGLFELRCKLQAGTVQQRVTYFFDPHSQVITLTTFRKQRNNERKQILRARREKLSWKGQEGS